MPTELCKKKPLVSARRPIVVDLLSWFSEVKLGFFCRTFHFGVFTLPERDGLQFLRVFTLEKNVTFIGYETRAQNCSDVNFENTNKLDFNYK
jgi:hypothetical protein